MLKLIKRELALYKKYIMITIIITLILFILGEIIGTLIINLIDIYTYIPIGVLLSIFGIFFITIFLLIRFYIGFDFAIKSSITRKNYLLGSISSMYIILITFCIFILLLTFLDKVYINLIS